MKLASAISCRLQCTKVSSKSKTKLNEGELLVFNGKTGILDFMSAVSGGRFLMNAYGLAFSQYSS